MVGAKKTLLFQEGQKMLSRLRRKRLLKELTLYDLQARTGIDSGRISLIERGYRIPKEDEKEKLSKALNCRVVDLFASDELSRGVV
jgi:transcriptional regulator with XRE-family HTH domain